MTEGAIATAGPTEITSVPWKTPLFGFWSKAVEIVQNILLGPLMAALTWTVFRKNISKGWTSSSKALRGFALLRMLQATEYALLSSLAKRC
jgi:hypothetical protein